ncbi:S8 family peptidase [Nonomuraea sp. M3C6]|uniref:S8 family peptidase n=1 Tax=Nonomuraea marmarensis TaxID=3351344 RepID=A0ABW7AGZ1_9ACTN
MITGDQVLVDSRGEVSSVEPGQGRRDVTFWTLRTNGHVRVLPSDAAPLVASGKLDERLFDITALLGFGYDDAHRDDLPLIITYTGAGTRAARPTVKAARPLPAIGGEAVQARKKDEVSALWATMTQGATTTRAFAGGIHKVWLDGKAKAVLDQSVKQIGAPAGWAAGYTGAGVKVAVLDTGVDQTHADLADREVGERNFTDSPDNVDRVGHGTHVASIVSGSGAKSGGKYVGVAPGARILDGKVLNDEGSGLESWIINGMSWAVDQGAKVVNLSLGAPDSAEIDPLEEAVNTLSAQHGTLFVVAAGNTAGAGTINSPGSADAALTVGAVDRDDTIAPFSSSGPRVQDNAVKPDLTAPGVGIVAAKAAEGTIGTPAGDGYVALNGTSMATPHVAGAAAILAQQHPDWPGDRLKALLAGSAKPNAAVTPFQQGAGRVDVAAATTLDVVAQPTTLDFGIHAWPHDDDQPVTKTVTYRNNGASEVTLNLAADIRAQSGDVAPAGMLKVEPNAVTVPAGGEAAVSVTADPRAGSADGIFSGTLIATSSESSVRTTLMVTREAATYELTLKYSDRAGNAPSQANTIVDGLDDGEWRFARPEDGVATLRLPAGRYFIATDIDTPRSTGGRDATKLLYPELSLDGEMTIALDARQAEQVQITPPDADATFDGTIINYERVAGKGTIKSAGWTDDLSGVYVGHLGPKVSTGSLDAQINAAWSRTDNKGRHSRYHLAWSRTGTFFTGLTRRVSKHELARVQVDYGARQPGTTGSPAVWAYSPNGYWGITATGQERPLPYSVTEYVNTDDVRWQWGITELNPEGGYQALVNTEPRTYRPGRDYHERLNSGIYGPAIAEPAGYGLNRDVTTYGLTRKGDTITLNASLFGDGAGNIAETWPTPAGTTTLTRDGKTVGELPTPGAGTFTVPTEKGTYRLTTEGTRPDATSTSTKVSAAWTFTSSRPTNADEMRLPLPVIQFSPPPDTATGSAAIQISVRHLPDDGYGRLHELRAEMSFDDGKTWANAPIHGGHIIPPRHPANPGAISLRAMAEDDRGNTVEQTIIRAYDMGKQP